MDIDRAVEQATYNAFRENYEGPEPPDPATCIVCGKKGTPTDSGWVENPKLHTDPEGDYWDGDALTEADDTKHGWVCSARCRSQVMYDHLDDNEKTAINAVVDACRVLSEYGERVREIVNRKTSDYIDYMTSSLVDEAAKLLAAVHDDSNDPPAWLNRPTAEEALWRGAHYTMLSLKYLAADLGICAKIDVDFGRNYQAGDEARMAVTAANLAIGLEETLHP
jgi:hypothetical protein